MQAITPASAKRCILTLMGICVSYAPLEVLNNFKFNYGPTMNAFEGAEKNSKELDLQHEIEALFTN